MFAWLQEVCPSGLAGMAVARNEGEGKPAHGRRAQPEGRRKRGLHIGLVLPRRCVYKGDNSQSRLLSYELVQSGQGGMFPVEPSDMLVSMTIKLGTTLCCDLERL